MLGNAIDDVGDEKLWLAIDDTNTEVDSEGTATLGTNSEI